MHFKDRFFNTLKGLISRPGFLTSEYRKGNRQGYVDPLLMYLCTAAIFFIIFFTGFRDRKISIAKPNGKNFIQNGTVHILKQSYKNAKTKEDSANIERTIRSLEDSSKHEANDDFDVDGLPLGLFDEYDTSYKNVAAYDSMQRLLPVDKKDGWFERSAKRRTIIFGQRYSHDSTQFWMDIINSFIHYFPWMVFVLLPVYALFLKLFYLRRKQFSFADHSIFLVHIYNFMFISLLLFLGILSLKQYTEEKRIWFAAFLIFVVGTIYAAKAMKRFYEQGWTKTILKFIFFNILCIAVLLAVFIVSFSISLTWQ